MRSAPIFHSYGCNPSWAIPVGVGDAVVTGAAPAGVGATAAPGLVQPASASAPATDRPSNTAERMKLFRDSFL
jgi:hypothetical protein